MTKSRMGLRKKKNPVTGQVGFGTQTVVTHVKVQAEKTKQPTAWDKTMAAGGPCQVGEKLWRAVVVSEARFPLLPPGGQNGEGKEFPLLPPRPEPEMEREKSSRMGRASGVQIP